MQGLWRDRQSGWNKDCKRKRVSRKRFLKDKKCVYKKGNNFDRRTGQFVNKSTLPDNIFLDSNEFGKNEMFYGRKPHPQIAYIMFGDQFSKKPYKKKAMKKGRAKISRNLAKELKGYKEASMILHTDDEYYDVDVDILDLDYDIKGIDLDID